MNSIRVNLRERSYDLVFTHEDLGGIGPCIFHSSRDGYNRRARGDLANNYPHGEIIDTDYGREHRRQVCKVRDFAEKSRHFANVIFAASPYPD